MYLLSQRNKVIKICLSANSFFVTNVVKADIDLVKSKVNTVEFKFM